MGEELAKLGPQEPPPPQPTAAAEPASDGHAGGEDAAGGGEAGEATPLLAEVPGQAADPAAVPDPVPVSSLAMNR